MNIKEAFQKICSVVPRHKVYVFGEPVIQFLKGETPEYFNVFIKILPNQFENEVLSSLPIFKSIKYYIGYDFFKFLKNDNPIIVNRFYIKAKHFFCDTDEEFYNSINKKTRSYKHLKKGIVEIAENKRKQLNPSDVLYAIEFASRFKMVLATKTLKEIIKQKHIFSNVDKQLIHKCLHNILIVKDKKLYIDYLNSLGISFELFQRNLKFNVLLRHLNKSDFIEMFFIIFDFHNEQELNEILNKCGINENDKKFFINILKIINSLDIADERYNNIETIYRMLNGQRVDHFCRLLLAFGLHHTSKRLLKYRNNILQKEKEKDLFKYKKKLCINKKILMHYFGSELKTNEINFLLQKAKEKIYEDPDYNNLFNIINYLKGIWNKQTG